MLDMEEIKANILEEKENESSPSHQVFKEMEGETFTAEEVWHIIYAPLIFLGTMYMGVLGADFCSCLIKNTFIAFKELKDLPGTGRMHAIMKDAEKSAAARKELQMSEMLDKLLNLEPPPNH